ncbi:MAG: glycerol-3-phosphate responsive antiterminator [Acholeplasma sp.]|nr:glycerol-3-phosphate responsive antiterminator [Acholeplasma sp.]
MIKDQRVIPAIGNHQDLKKFFDTNLDYGILMNFQLAQLPELVLQMKEHQKKVLIHSELIKGLNSDEFGAIYLIQTLKVDGIISSKPKVIETCKKRKIIGILRFFLKDSVSLQQGLDVANKVNPDYLEVLPALCLDIIPEIKQNIRCDIMMGGLIRTKEQIASCLLAGAVAVTTSNSNLWL